MFWHSSLPFEVDMSELGRMCMLYNSGSYDAYVVLLRRIDLQVGENRGVLTTDYCDMDFKSLRDKGVFDIVTYTRGGKIILRFVNCSFLNMDATSEGDRGFGSIYSCGFSFEYADVNLPIAEVALRKVIEGKVVLNENDA